VTDVWPALLVLQAILAFVPASIASRKGHSWFGWWVFGALLFIVALPFALLSRDTRARCPECTEPVNASAVRCPHCSAEIGGRVVVPAPVR
jgi:hypothetical protein